eukprot:CAMPEP_0183324656 /NCGR_PEP_ID=MMETSP0160_2-20130417/77577_1 /TAXON_ID=2839 ORGANISM="Odontella Sinensis, Strain Grunow 1884" /NCGR_SAMPLE_ID=MMETSP0160_2 /ASSEMBLY_ACC=CAM_ASM_000250 /LENGTH=100 /DNA_ID=CAMNT_0025492277 /DNA_START=90 /DNA_END=388 /DNA_ORIENTATION=+
MSPQTSNAAKPRPDQTGPHEDKISMHMSMNRHFTSSDPNPGCGVWYGVHTCTSAKRRNRSGSGFLRLRCAPVRLNPARPMGGCVPPPPPPPTSPAGWLLR